MAKIDDIVAVAFCSGAELTTGNTVVKSNQEGVLLCGHKIAQRASHEQGICIVVDHCGYHTRTTMTRLSAILQRYTDGRVRCGLNGGKAELRYSDGTTKPFDKPTVVWRTVSWIDGSEIVQSVKS